MTMVGDAISQLGASPTSEALSAATNVIFAVLPQIESHYRQAMRSAQEIAKEKDEVTKLRLELENAKEKILKDAKMRKDKLITQV